MYVIKFWNLELELYVNICMHVSKYEILVLMDVWWKYIGEEAFSLELIQFILEIRKLT